MKTIAASSISAIPTKARGVYVDQIKRWMEHFPREQFLFLCSEEMNARPNEVCGEVFLCSATASV
jgi:hypothetical protein